MIPSQLQMFPRYEVSGQRYPTLRAAAAAVGHVTYNRSHALERRPGDAPKMELYNRRAKRIRSGPYSRPTLLRDVRAVFPEPDSSLRALYGRGRGAEVISTTELAHRAFDAVENHLAATWNPAARHVMMFSSGYDTRILGACLARLARRHGPEWLGEIRFCCFWPEVEYARRSLRACGLPDAAFVPIGEKRAVDYYADCLDFETMGLHISEAERFWGGPLKTQLQLAPYLDTSTPLQGTCALFGDELTKWNRLNWGNVAWFLACFYFDNPNVFPSRPDVEFILPFASENWVRLQTTYRMPELSAYPARIRTLVHGTSAIDALKLSILDAIDPALAEVSNWRFEARAVRERNRGPTDPGRGHLDEQKIGAQTATRMEQAYRASWYAKTVGPDRLDYGRDRTFVYWSDRNVHYMKAAIFEQLLRDGVTVSI